ncbi:SMR domain-containing protein At5g58720-like isoform X2 [Bidens hawaiensis]|uniref:SMR domain-containing protein At5g58720-like isoform X2 n=1 Tax=Bidens hawaiensis TaxID=980011 RepID=UPI00404AD9B5
MKHPKKKKRHRPPISKPKEPNPPNPNPQNPNSDQTDDQSRVLNALTDAIGSIGSIFIDDASSSSASATREDDAAEIFGSLTETGSSSSSGSSGLSNCDGFNRAGAGKIGKGGRGSKVIAATGMVASVIGKDYVPKKRGVNKLKVSVSGDGGASHDDAEQFLCSMLGDECEFGMDLVKDVLCQTAYDVEKALDILLELTAPPSSELDNSGQRHNLNAKSKDIWFDLESSDSLNNSTSDLASSSDTDHSMGFNRRNYFNVLAGDGPHPSSVTKNTSELTQEVLESLFNTPKSSKHEPESMNWRNVVKKMESLGQGLDYASEDTVNKQHVPGNDYQEYRTTASQHWDSMKSYYHKAATAYADGKREYAAYLSDQGRICNEKARKADERASQDIFSSRNKNIENVITIDLHGQHVKQGMKLLKLHLLFGAYVRSVRLFRVIAGCGSHGLGKSKLKQSVVNLLEAENIEYREENRGTLLIKLNGQREFSFLDSASDTD